MRNCQFHYDKTLAALSCDKLKCRKITVKFTLRIKEPMFQSRVLFAHNSTSGAKKPDKNTFLSSIKKRKINRAIHKK